MDTKKTVTVQGRAMVALYVAICVVVCLAIVGIVAIVQTLLNG